MTEFAALKLQTYSYLTDDNDESKNAKGTENHKTKCVTKPKHNLEDCEHCLEATDLEKEINYLVKSKLAVDSKDLEK